MTKYFFNEEFYKAKKQRKIVLSIYFVVLAVYSVLSVGFFLWFRTLPYKSTEITTVKFLHYGITAIFVIFSFIYLGVPFKRVNRYYKMTINMIHGLKETFVAVFLEYDENIRDKDGVDYKSLIFLEWNKYKQDFYERRVLVPYEKEFPKFEANQNIEFITQGNVLVSYKILP
ncbi:MAG: hypothetical protein E7372_00975 [Clostridiales bacterium]|nr:hypothetical protein [Clostridiales bacterium]